MRKIILLLSTITLIFVTCSSDFPGSTLKPQILYDFGTDDVCNAPVEKLCFSSSEDYAIYMAAQAELAILNTVAIDNKLENDIGNEFHASSGFSFIENSQLTKLQGMLAKMKPYISRKEVNYRVYLIKSNDINALTLPGGRIYFTTGMMDFIASDHEMAIILGHEIGHNECKHTHKHLQRLALAQLPMQLFGLDMDASFFVELYNAAVVAFGQHQELEADRHGFQLAAKIGYDPKIGLNIWKRLSAYESPNLIDKLFSSHPYSQSRYSCGVEYIDKHKVKK